MDRTPNYLYQIYWALMSGNDKRVKKLAKQTQLKHEIIGCDKISEVIFKSKGEYYIKFTKHKKGVDISVTNESINLWNTPLFEVVQNYTYLTFAIPPVPHQSLDIVKHKNKDKILVLIDYDPDTAITLASIEYCIDCKVVQYTNADDVRAYIKKGYKYIVGPSYTSNLLELSDVISENPDVKFISPLSTYNGLISRQNLIRLCLCNRQFADALSRIVTTPVLIFSDDTTVSNELANYIVEYIPNSVIVALDPTVSYLTQTEEAINMYPDYTNLFFSFNSTLQEYWDALANSTILDNKTLFTTDALQINPPTNITNTLYSLRGDYTQTILYDIIDDYFDYFYADALYYQQQVLYSGVRNLGSLTGVIELDSEGNRYYTEIGLVSYSNDNSKNWKLYDTVKHKKPLQ